MQLTIRALSAGRLTLHDNPARKGVACHLYVNSLGRQPLRGCCIGDVSDFDAEHSILFVEEAALHQDKVAPARQRRYKLLHAWLYQLAQGISDILNCFAFRYCTDIY